MKILSFKSSILKSRTSRHSSTTQWKFHPSRSQETVIKCAQRIDLSGNAIAIAPSRSRPRGIVHFLGGAFAGAAPYLFYPSLIDQIAEQGYTVVLTPYAITFRHDLCARTLHENFQLAVAELQSNPRTLWAAPEAAPVHGMGHSNGALMHAMIASLMNPPNASNVLISFNNRQVKEAVPVPLDPLQALVLPLRGNTRLESMVKSTLDQVLRTAEGFGSGALVDEDTLRMLRQQITPTATQLGAVFDEVGDGTQEFTPPPEQNLKLFETAYAVPQTLLIQFADDGIDQSPLLEKTLGGSGGGGSQVQRGVMVVIEKMAGNHLTPVGASPQMRVPGAFGPAEVLAQAAIALSQTDLRRVGQRTVEWMDRQQGTTTR